MKELLVNDNVRALNLLLKLANKEESKYVLKKYITRNIGSYETIHGDRESGIFKGEIWLIAQNDCLEEIDKWSKEELAITDGYQYGITKLINDGYSIIVITNYYDDWCVLPHSIKNANITKIKNICRKDNDIYCYTYDDELGEALNKLEDYIEQYDGKIHNISLNTIVDRINNLENIKTYKK